ncbi:HNH endonuclease [Corynebacterium imitans]|uniref:HNH endonuclease n=1 Tax=Corynebacterium imitans TaxID=156978 RepID=UPI00254A0EEB|nr:HNH endonuclease [Corynebacterium imitans]MDK8637518.1 HNH endonuclease [Corynebacterium imitans]MDK8772080.1 HNH endonuclease [Corynebacterium imitans]
MDIPAWGGRRAVEVTAAYREQCAADGLPCWLCGQPIDYNAAGGTPNAFELDHFYPRTDYPELTWEESNFRPSHSGCNRSRGKRDAPAAIGPTTIAW